MRLTQDLISFAQPFDNLLVDLAGLAKPNLVMPAIRGSLFTLRDPLAFYIVCRFDGQNQIVFSSLDTGKGAFSIEMYRGFLRIFFDRTEITRAAAS